MLQVLDPDFHISQLPTSNVWKELSSVEQCHARKAISYMFNTTLSFMYPNETETVWKDVSSYDITGTRLKQTVSHMIREDRNVLENIINAIEDAPTSSVKIQVLSLIADQYTRQELCQMSPLIYKGLVDAAREHAVKEGPGAPKEPLIITRDRLDESKVEHFFDFIIHPDFVQDVAYGTQNITIDEEDEKIPSLIRTVVNGRLIKIYLEHCKQIRYKPLSESVLFKLLNECCPAKQSKSLSGLDNTAAAGENSCTNLVDILRYLKTILPDPETSREIQNDIILMQEINFYLKQELKSHISLDNECPDHCIKWALSDPKQKKFQEECTHQHRLHCEKCNYINTLKERLTKHVDKLNPLLGEQYDEYLLDIAVNTKNISEWKGHILRTLNQGRCKDYILTNMKRNEVLIVIDYPMKFLPRKFREPQESYFGKPGLSWHVAVAIMKEGEDYCLKTYVTMLNRCPQDSYAVCCILKHVLCHFTKEHPRVKHVYLRSDNAGYYHSVETISSLCNEYGIKIKRYDFSEAQSGKDVCDRKTASMKTHINNYCNAGNDVTDGAAMMEALVSYGGVKGTSVSVMAPDYSSKQEESTSIPAQISTINNIEYMKNGIRVYRSYGIGSGLDIKNDQIKHKPSPPVYNEITGFTEILSKGQMRNKKHDESDEEEEEEEEDDSREIDAEGAGRFFQCSICSKSYRYQHFLDQHMITGKHLKPKTSVYTKMKKKWVAFAQAKEIKPSAIRQAPAGLKDGPSNKGVQMGWALKVHTKSKRFSPEIKDHLRMLYDLGEKTRNKVSAEEAERLIRNARTADGKRMFPTEDWLTAKQIKNLFGRFTAQKTLKLKSVDEVPEEYGEDDIVADLARAAVRKFANQ